MPPSLMSTSLFGNSPRLGVEVVNDHLLRIVEPRGPVIGHIETVSTREGERFAARRLLAGGRRVLELGFFWNITEAAECFR